MTLEGIAGLIAGFTAGSIALAVTSCAHMAARSRVTSKRQLIVIWFESRELHSPTPFASLHVGLSAPGRVFHLLARRLSGLAETGWMEKWHMVEQRIR